MTEKSIAHQCFIQLYTHYALFSCTLYPCLGAVNTDNEFRALQSDIHVDFHVFHGPSFTGV